MYGYESAKAGLSSEQLLGRFSEENPMVSEAVLEETPGDTFWGRRGRDTVSRVSKDAAPTLKDWTKVSSIWFKHWLHETSQTMDPDRGGLRKIAAVFQGIVFVLRFYFVRVLSASCESDSALLRFAMSRKRRNLARSKREGR